MNWLNRLRKGGSSVGLELDKGHISLAVKPANGDGLSTVHVVSTEANVEWQSLVCEFLEKQQLKNARCNVVLTSIDYQLLLVEAPDVPENELREAVKWRVKDLIQGSVEESVIDVFALPADASRAGKKMVYVAVAKLARINQIITLIKDLGLELNSIDIEVLALRNLTLFKQFERGAAVVRLKAGAGDVSIYRDGNLYLSRHFQLNYGAGLLDDIPADSLALEVQRSFDYFERQMGQVPPSVLFLCGEGIGADKISDELRRAMSAPIEFLELTQETGIDPQEYDEGMMQLCMGAIGAVYKEAVA